MQISFLLIFLPSLPFQEFISPLTPKHKPVLGTPCRRRDSLFAELALVDVSVLDLLQAADELVERVVVDYQAGHSVRVVRHDVGRPDVLTGGSGGQQRSAGVSEVNRGQQKLT